MLAKKKFIAAAVTSVALMGTCFVTTAQDVVVAAQEVKSSSWVNDYIAQNNIRPVGIEYRQGTFNRWFGYKNGVGKPEGIVVHETATPGATAENEVAFFNNNWKRLSTYVHAFVDANKIINIHSSDYGVWGAGYTANQKYIQVELCRVNNKDQFARSIANDAFYIASKLIQYGLPFVPNQTIVTHHQVSQRFGETNHTDPDGYFAQWGYDMNQFNQLIGKYYNSLKATNNANGSTTNGQSSIPNKHVGRVDVNNPNSFYVPIVAFDQAGNTSPSNRGLANKSPWYTDQQRQHNGHTYYRVSTNEWVEDTYSQFTAAN